ncbi:MAG: purine-nucleoside phosphorylase [Thermodesulfobacteriota bacterium]|nr:purine-nucleoside phosphorylase [Thermodesulfobacteriota bacterium]
MKLLEKIEEARGYIASQTEMMPRIGIVLGTGLGGLVESIQIEKTVPYENIPHFPTSTVKGHIGNMIFGTLSEKEVLAMQGRFHYYEGYSMEQVTFPLRVMKAFGIEVLIISNAAGGLNPRFSPGDIMIIADHINLTGNNPLIGTNPDTLGPRFPDMTQPYAEDLISLLEDVALDEKIRVHKGVYVGVSGPSLETCAETRFLRMIGSDAVGMSTIPEVIVAVHSGIKVLGLSVISNVNLPDNYTSHPLEDIIAVAESATPKLVRLVERTVKEMEI